MQLDAVIKFRVPKVIRARLSRIAKEKMKTLTEVGREAIKSYIESEESCRSKRSEKEAA